MLIAGFSKMTLLDFPGLVAAEVFLQGCSMRCPFCHNSELCPPDCASPVPWDDVLAYLTARKSMLDGIVFTGGEPCMQDVLPALMACKGLGLRVKLDTNGMHPDRLDGILSHGAADYVAMDIKADPDGYPAACGLARPDLDAIRESVRLLLEYKVPHEFRTTVTPSLHSPGSVRKLCRAFVPPDSSYFVQGFVPRDTVPGKKLTVPEETFLHACVQAARETVPATALRGSG